MISTYFFLKTYHLSLLPKRLMKIRMIKNQQIGVLKNTEGLPLDFSSAVRKFFSAIGPKIRPRIAGLVGTLTLERKYPTTPAISMTHTSKKLFFMA